EVNDIILKTVAKPSHSSPVAGFDVTTSTIAPNVGTIFYSLPSLYGKHVPGVTAATMLPRVRAALSGIKDAVVIVVNPHAAQGPGAPPLRTPPAAGARSAGTKDVVVLVATPPAVQGLGAAGGFKLMVEDRG